MALDSASDVFLSVQTKRAGKIKGEATTDGHEDEISLVSWAWGVKANTAIGSTEATARRVYRPLVICKGIDSASTALMSALVTNDEVREAKLTMRKAGGSALDYFKMTLSGARVIAVDLDIDARGMPIERIEIAFTTIDIEYERQSESGISAGAYSFSDEVLPA